MQDEKIEGMSAVSLVFPHQLFENHPALAKNRPVYLIEEYLFFSQYNFHKQKLVFHRASMKAFQDLLEKKGFEVHYVEAIGKLSDIRDLVPALKKHGISEVHYTDVTDNYLGKRLTEQALKLGMKATTYESPLFLLSRHQVSEYFAGKKRFFQTDFYIKQRKQFTILVDAHAEPVGGKWSFDSENRLKYPKGKTPPQVNFPAAGKHWLEATEYVEKNFRSNYGSINASFSYPVTHAASRKWLNEFLENRFVEFGPFEDALVKEEHILHHSVLTPMLNVGLITPAEVIDQAVAFAQKNTIPLNSCEGFIRQILGWREFIRGLYETTGTRERSTNYWKFKRKIPRSFWTGKTGIAPVDDTIAKILSTGYAHHIERLMVLGNFMLLCEFDPDEVYRWFMELFIDAYDWVMVPNVYGMSQFADGGLMATKPYISGSNYLIKMSNYEKGDWQLIWDGLFWRFMHTHRKFFLSNPRLGMLVKTFDRMPAKKKEDHLQRATQYLNTLDETA